MKNDYFLLLLAISPCLSPLIINNLMLPVPCVPTKREWKTINNRTLKWNRIVELHNSQRQRLYVLSHTAPFYHTIEFVSSIQQIVWYMMLIVALLWTRPVVLENRLSIYCNLVHQEELVHALFEYSVTSTKYIIPGTANWHSATRWETFSTSAKSVAFTQNLLGAPIELIFDASTDHMCLRIASSFIVNCVNVFFVKYCYIYSNWK